MFETIIFLALIGSLLWLLWRRAMSGHEHGRGPDTLDFVVVMTLGVLVMLYSRFVLFGGMVFASTDEARLIEIYASSFTRPIGSLNSSGPGTVLVARFFGEMCGLDVFSAPAFVGGVMGAAYPLLLLSVYRLAAKRPLMALAAVSSLFLASHYVWSSLESRSQLFGMFMLVLAAILIYRFTWSDGRAAGRYLGAFMVLTAALLVVHILSFLILVLVAGCILYHGYLRHRLRLPGLSLAAVYMALLFALFIVPGFIYSRMSKSAEFILLNSQVLPSTIAGLDVLVGLYLVSMAALIAFLAVHHRFGSSFRGAYERILGSLVRARRRVIGAKRLRWPLFIAALLMLWVVVYVQFTTDSDRYSTVYRDSLALFLVFQVGNVLFATAFFASLLFERRIGMMAPVLIPCLVLAGLGPVILFFSLTLQNAAQNWLIRVVYYFIPFGAPLVGMGLYRIRSNLPKKAAARTAEKRGRLATVMIAALVLSSLVSLVAASKDPAVFNNEYYWGGEDIDAVSWIFERGDNASHYYARNTLSDVDYVSKERSYGKLGQTISHLNGDMVVHVHFSDIIPASADNRIFASDNIHIHQQNGIG